jgi:uncharacterized phage infection (PIP) family protein YhgE
MKKLTLFATFTLFFFLIACAHTPTRSDQMLTYSEDAQGLSKQWNQGDKMINEAQSLKAKGTNLIQDGQKQIANASNLINDGNKNITAGHQMLLEGEKLLQKGMLLKNESEINFQNKFPQAQI